MITGVGTERKIERQSCGQMKVENGIGIFQNLFATFGRHWKFSELEIVRIGNSQNWKLSELEIVTIGFCQNWNMSESEIIRIGNCQNWKLSELEIVRIEQFLNRNLSELEFVRDLKCADKKLSIILSFKLLMILRIPRRLRHQVNFP